MGLLTADMEETTEGTSDPVDDGKVPVPKPPSIEDFSILKPISRGAFGKVYLARKKATGHLYAIKVVKKAEMINKNMVQQVHAERDALALSKSPFIVHLYYSLQSANNIYLVMEYLIGGDVKSLLHIYGYFEEDMAVTFSAEVALALDYLHRHGIIHRDLKPDNMLISNVGHIKLTDFGLSKVNLKRELNMVDILTTPSMLKPKQDYSRTPGQVLSLISSLGFHTPGAVKRNSTSHTPAAMSAETFPGNFNTPKALNPKSKTVPVNKLLIACPSNNSISPGMPVKCLTPNLLKYRGKSSSDSSQSHICLSSVESSRFTSPKWEKDAEESEMISTNEKSKNINASGDTASQISANSKEYISLLKKEQDLTSTPREISTVANRMELRESLQLNETPLVSSTAKGNIRKCLYSMGIRENEELVFEDTAVSKDTDLDIYKISSIKANSLLEATNSREEEGNFEKAGGKRIFELVDKSPSQELIVHKKSNAEYTRGCEIGNFLSQRNTGLTEEIGHLMLSGNKCLAEGYTNIEKPDTSGPQISEISAEPTVAKNLFCELDEQYDKDSKKNPLSSSVVSNEDVKALGEISSVESDMSIAECQMDKNLSEVSEGVKELSFEETGAENGLFLHLSCQETKDNLEKSIQEHAAQPEKQCPLEGPMPKPFLDALNGVAVPALGKSQPFSDKKKNVVFRSYNSAIDGSTISELSKMTVGSLENMDFSPACTGSYCMAVTPAPNGQSCNIFQRNAETPFRTPKSVRRGATPVDKGRILGTPDYLAPELLLQKPHGFLVCDAAVDWWALGVCLFEFLTGIPPFNDETQAQVFSNVLNRNIPWPKDEETLSPNAQAAIEILLCVDSTKRAGLKELKDHPLFEGLDWNNLQNQTMPFVPQPDDETDTAYFDARNNAQHLTVSAFSW